MEEKIEYQYIMESRVYRRKMIFTRVAVSVVVAGGLVSLVAVNLMVGILLPVAVLFIGAVWVIAGLQSEMTYTVFNTRFVIKNKEKRISVPLENVISVKYRSAFYEKKYCTGTITIIAKSPDSGRKKTYKMKHVFDGRAGADYIAEAADKNGEEKNNADQKD